MTICWVFCQHKLSMLIQSEGAEEPYPRPQTPRHGEYIFPGICGGIRIWIQVVVVVFVVCQLSSAVGRWLTFRPLTLGYYHVAGTYIYLFPYYSRSSGAALLSITVNKTKWMNWLTLPLARHSVAVAQWVVLGNEALDFSYAALCSVY